jgi:beta-phosphoglucomutase-like phosphatase (HAD superfamily)
MCEENIVVSALPKTWILDLDGTIVKHNGYKIDGQDTLLPGIEGFLRQIRAEDMVIFVTSRTPEYAAMTEEFLAKNKIRFDHIIYGAPYGERILVNDKKPSGLRTAIAVNTERDVARKCNITADSDL